MGNPRLYPWEIWGNLEEKIKFHAEFPPIGKNRNFKTNNFGKNKAAHKRPAAQLVFTDTIAECGHEG
jgi:hypothetical protein